jgi:hypothetical protein
MPPSITWPAPPNKPAASHKNRPPGRFFLCPNLAICQTNPAVQPFPQNNIREKTNNLSLRSENILNEIVDFSVHH